MSDAPARAAENLRRPDEPLPAGPVAPASPPAALAKAPEAVKRSMPMALSFAIGILLAAFFAWFFYQLTWFILLLYLSFILATIVEAPVSWLKNRGVPRTLATVLVLLTGLALLGGVGYLLITSLNAQMSAVAHDMQKVPARISAWVNGFKQRFPAIAQNLGDFDLATALAGAIPSFGATVGKLATVMETVTYIVVTFFTVMYMVIEGPDHLQSARRLLPKHARLEATRLFESMTKAHRGWFLASTGNVASAAVLTSTGLWIVGLPGAIVLGAIAGLGELIPNVGPALFALPSILLTLVIKPDAILWVLLMFAIVQTIQSYTISPLMMKIGVELPVLVTIISVLVMGTLFGLLGVLVAIPLVADLVVVWNYFNTLLERDATDNDAANDPPTPR